MHSSGDDRIDFPVRKHFNARFGIARLIRRIMIQEIRAKTLLIACKDADSWFGVRYRFNIYRGCEHQCIYCDSRSECYGIESFADVQVKVNAIELLEQELARKRQVAFIGTGVMSDPYTPAERLYHLTGRSLQVLARRHFGAHIMTKSDLVLRDVEILSEIARLYCSVAFSIDTTDDILALKLEPGAVAGSRKWRQFSSPLVWPFHACWPA